MAGSRQGSLGVRETAVHAAASGGHLSVTVDDLGSSALVTIGSVRPWRQEGDSRVGRHMDCETGVMPTQRGAGRLCQARLHSSCPSPQPPTCPPGALGLSFQKPQTRKQASSTGSGGSMLAWEPPLCPDTQCQPSREFCSSLSTCADTWWTPGQHTPHTHNRAVSLCPSRCEHEDPVRPSPGTGTPRQVHCSLHSWPQVSGQRTATWE